MNSHELASRLLNLPDLPVELEGCDCTEYAGGVRLNTYEPSIYIYRVDSAYMPDYNWHMTLKHICERIEYRGKQEAELAPYKDLLP